MTEAGTRIATSWLEWLYGEKIDGNISICGHGRWAGSRFADIDAAVRYAMNFDAGQTGIGGTYHRLTTLNDSAPRRGVDEDSVTLYSVSLDLDLRGPGHVSDEYPETEEQLREVLAAAGLPEPSAWVNSGGGRYPHWKLTEPIRLTDSEQEFKRGQELLRSVQRAVAQQATKRGWKLDNTSDLARVYRLPGTLNRKGETPVMATWALGSGRTYDADELQPPAPTPEPAPVAPPMPMSELGGPLFASPSSILFDEPGAPRTDTRVFTLQEAMQYVARPLQNLREAPAGRINDTLNATACEIAHFGPQFWGRDAAIGQILDALGHTEYDGQTWKAEDTIASAYAAMTNDWQAILAPPPTEALAAAVTATPADAVDALLAEMLTPEQVTERKPPRYLIHGLLQFDSESWIIGPPGSKKSFVVLDQAARVAAGQSWQGRRTNPADVVMIVAEGSGGVGKRIKAWTAKHGPMREGIRILPRPVQAGSPEKWAVLVGACRVLAASARERGRGLLVIVDTQARVTVGLKENDATDMGVFIDAVSAIRQATGGCVYVVHHTGRAGGDARGSSAVDGAQTTELKIIPGKGKLAARLSVEKQKDIEEIEPIDLAFEVVDVGVDEDGERVSSLVLAEPGSAAFRAAYEGAETTHEDIEAIEEGKAHLLTARVVVDHWIREKTWSRPTQWAIQILCDIGRERGLTKSEVKAMVEQKIGQEVKRTTWNDTWTLITDSSREWAGVVVPASGERWTVDPTAVEAFRK